METQDHIRFAYSKYDARGQSLIEVLSRHHPIVACFSGKRSILYHSLQSEKESSAAHWSLTGSQ